MTLGSQGLHDTESPDRHQIRHADGRQTTDTHPVRVPRNAGTQAHRRAGIPLLESRPGGKPAGARSPRHSSRAVANARRPLRARCGFAGDLNVATARFRWREYGIEAALLAAFMISAVAVTALLEYPASPIRQAPSRRVLPP